MTSQNYKHEEKLYETSKLESVKLIKNKIIVRDKEKVHTKRYFNEQRKRVENVSLEILSSKPII